MTPEMQNAKSKIIIDFFITIVFFNWIDEYLMLKGKPKNNISGLPFNVFQLITINSKYHNYPYKQPWHYSYTENYWI
jgi:hypothetical protein